VDLLLIVVIIVIVVVSNIVSKSSLTHRGQRTCRAVFG